MAMTVRQSILNRPKRGPSLSNEQNIDKEYEKELAKMRAKQEQRQYYEDGIRAAVEPAWVDKVKQQETMRAHMQAQLREKEEQKRQEWLQERIDHDKNINMDKYSDKKWQESEAEKQQQRKEYLRKIMEENKRIVAMKHEMDRQQKAKEVEEDMRIREEGTFNRRHFL